MATAKKVEVPVRISDEETKKKAARYMALASRKKAIEEEMDYLKQTLVTSVKENGSENKVIIPRSKDVITIAVTPCTKQYVTFEELKRQYPKVAAELRKTSSWVALKVTKTKKGEGK